MSEDISADSSSKDIKPNTWLKEYARSVASQGGEDGVIEKVLEVISETNKWCVEFGSWDGKKLSNTYNLIKNKDYSAVLIECNKKRFTQLLQTFKKNKKVITLNRFVSFDEHNCLGAILKSTPVPKDFDLLSIDIDGNDYHVWEAVKSYKPKVVIIEFNPTIPAPVEFVQSRDVHITQGSSLLSISKLAKSKGYELVWAVGGNAIFVDSTYFDLLGIKDNSVDVMWTDRSAITHIFCGYDGTVFIRGHGEIPWQKIRYRESKVQQLPKWARKRVGDHNILRRKLGKYFRRLRKKNII